LKKDKIVFLCAIYLAVIWILACLPLASVLIEYRDIVLCADAALRPDPSVAPGPPLGWFLATLYGSFFIFPVTIGALAMVALVLPLSTVVSLTSGQRSGYVLLAFYVATTAVICLLEVHSSPNAIFQLPPNIIFSQPTFLTGLNKAVCLGQKFVNYRNQLGALIPLGHSVTGAVYYVGFAALTLMQNALFTVFIAFIYLRRDAITRKAPYLQGVIFFILGYALFLGSIWCLFRLSYRNDMLNLFATTNPFAGDYGVVALNVVVLAVWVLYFQFNLEQLAKTFAQIGQLAAVVGGAAVVHFDSAGTFFGTRASVVNILALTLLFFFITALVAAFLLRQQRS
jgi:hypothetical protein